MFTSTLTTAATLSVSSALINITCAIVLGLLIALTYMSSDKYSRNFVITLVMLPLLVQIVIMLVNGNLGTGMAVLGAFSLVRFRSIPGSSKEISFIFFAMAIGLATGMGYITYAIASTLIMCLLFLILSKSKFASSNDSMRNLKITIPEDLDYTDIFDDLFDKYTKKSELVKVKTTNLGSMFELNYSIEMKNISEEKKLIDELRCRNGNLTISLNRNQYKDEL